MTEVCEEQHCAAGNSFLDSLPADSQMLLRQALEPVNLPTGSIIAIAGRPVRDVYFPEKAVVSLLHSDREGAGTRVGIVGSEGALGLGVCFGEPHPFTALVLVGGRALRMDAQWLPKVFAHRESLCRTVIPYAADLMGQAWQIAVCNRYHAPAQQLCSLLLQVMDRGGSGNLPLTHNLIARLLGVRRETVTQAATRIQALGYVQYARGYIRVLDRVGLETMSCGCWRPPLARAADD
ncbi:Crp/Fnr family transcriptional regulator [Ramlibacter humi]|nr:Crp/Fnr family transcriptional regulator [Ramlibacter humi]